MKPTRNALGRGLGSLISMDDTPARGTSAINDIDLSQISPNPEQPSTTFDWILTIRSRLNSEDTPTPAYGQVEKALRSLTTEPEQLIILWQQNPNNADAYWFIRCSVYARSKDNDIYLIEVAFPHNGGKEFWQKTVKYLTDALPYFDAAYHHKIIDFTGFEKQEE